MRTRSSYEAVSVRTRSASERKARAAEARAVDVREIIDLDDSDSEKRSNKRSRGSERRNTPKGGAEKGRVPTGSKADANASSALKGADENDSEAKKKRPKKTVSSYFCGDPIERSEAMRRWPHRYPVKDSKEKARFASKSKIVDSQKGGMEDKLVLESVAHYQTADVDGIIYELGDCVYVNSDSGPDYIGRVIEFFKGIDGNCWFCAQWFYRPHDTAIGQEEAKGHDKKRIFFSTMKDDNLLECITSKINIIHVPALTRFESKLKSVPSCDYYYDMGYDYAFSRFYNLPDDNADTEVASCDSASTVSSDEPSNLAMNTSFNVKSEKGSTIAEPELSLLDLYSGCGAMSTGLCMGAALSGVKLVTRWAVDLSQYACESLKYNHPETEVRNEEAENFLLLLKEWEKLCTKYHDYEVTVTANTDKHQTNDNRDDSDREDDSELDDDEYEVEKLIGIRFHTPKVGKGVLEFKVRWKGYGEDEDSWEPIDGLMSCEDRVVDFVKLGLKKKILPLPGHVDVICGGPPCQGVSGFNRFRNVAAPLDDPRNHQIVVFMDIVDYLRPRFILMENVVDILKFAGGILGQYALSSLVKMHYQAKLGLMVAGCYGLPQFRMRVFLWGASPVERLPPYPLPTHDVVVRGSFPVSWEHNAVAYDETQRPDLEKAIVLGDAISDLPLVKNSETRDEIPYNRPCRTDFQRFVRLPREILEGKNFVDTKKTKPILLDHRSLELNVDDFQRTCRIPKRKGANFRDLEGVIVLPDNTVKLDLENRVMLPSGKPLVPDYAITFVHGRSTKPFGRLWWDEIVSTVVTRAEPHNQVILHPEQDRVLTIRENARIQGFPDYYKFFGPVKQRYIQVGNAVAIPVAKALGYELGLAIQKQCDSSAVVELPQKFPHSLMGIGNGPLSMQDIEEKF